MIDDYHIIEADLKQVNSLVNQTTEDQSHPIAGIADHLLSAPGKQLRPRLYLLCSRVLSPAQKPAYNIPAALELLHNASLAHDDVIDKADERRGNPSINQTFGNGNSVLSGNWMYAEACRLLLRERNWTLLEAFFDTVQQMLESEGQQMKLNSFYQSSESLLLENIQGKTASLFLLCAKSACISMTKTGTVAKSLQEFALNFGMAFQIADDMNDTCIPDQNGQNGFTPPEALNLPLFYAWKNNGAEKRQVLQSVLVGDQPAGTALQRMLSDEAVQTDCRRVLNVFLDRAACSLKNLPDSVFRDDLDAMLQKLGLSAAFSTKQ